MTTGLRFGVLRGDDLLALDFELVDLQFVATGDRPPFLRPRPGRDAFLIVHLPPQHIFEQAFPAETRPTPDRLPAKAILARPSRLVFAVGREVPFTLAALLAWDNPAWSLQAANPDELAGGPPGDLQSAIEVPYRLLLSPAADARWQHAVDPVTRPDGERAGWTELWHSRLEPGAERQGRVWVAAARGGSAEDPFLGPMDAAQRLLIAAASTAATRAVGVPDIPVDRLVLSPLGAWLDLHGRWETVDWRHVAAMGRDQYVRVVEPGFLYPFGHRALRTTISERRFSDDQVAALQQHHTLTVVEPERSFRPETTLLDGRGFPHGGREFPFATVRIVTVETPPLQELVAGNWPIVADRPFRFDLLAEDWNGGWSAFQLPLAFVPDGGTEPTWDAAVVDLLGDAAGSVASQPPVLVAPLAGQPLTVVDPQRLDRQAPTEHTRTLTVDLLRIGDVGRGSRDAGGPPFLPRLHSLRAGVDAVDRFVGARHAIEVAPAALFLEQGFDPGQNAAQVFAEVVGAPLRLDLAAEQVGGLLTPAAGSPAGLSVLGLSRTLGVVSGHGATLSEVVADVASGTFDPRQFLGDMAILGSISLDALVEQALDAAPALANLDDLVGAAATDEQILASLADPALTIPVPVLHSRVDPAAPTSVPEVRFLWKPKLKTITNPIITLPQPGTPPLPVTQLRIVVSLVPPAEGQPPGYRVNGVLTAFTLPLLGVLEIGFERLSFLIEPQRGPLIRPAISGIVFKGALAFVSEIQEVLKEVTGDLPFDVDISATAIRLRHALEIPSFAFSVFSVRDIAFATSLFLPLLKGSGRENAFRVRFALSERADPFAVAVGILGGGGFFALELSTAGDVQVEAAIEFGGMFAVDFLVARGSVHCLAGIYLRVDGTGVELTGYLRCGGAVEILGIIAVSVEFYIGLTYDSGRNVLSGTAAVNVCVEVLFLSKCVSFEVHKEFAGGDGVVSTPAPGRLGWAANAVRSQPARAQAGAGFADLLSRQDWADYCRAFAAP